MAARTTPREEPGHLRRSCDERSESHYKIVVNELELSSSDSTETN